MADIKRCDRCNKVYDQYSKKLKISDDICYNGSWVYNGFIFTKDNTVYDFVKQQDLCPECLDSLLKWFNEKRGTFKNG